MSGFKVFTVGEVLTASNVNTYFAQQNYVRKSASENVSSSASLQDDNHLTLSVAASTTYIFRVVLTATSAANAAGDIAIGFNFPSGATVDFGGFGPNNAALPSGSSAEAEFIFREGATAATTNIPYGLSTNPNTITLDCHVAVSSTAGSVTLSWAQQSSNVNNSTVRAGSWMRAWKVS